MTNLSSQYKYFRLGIGAVSYDITNPGAESGDMTGWTAELGTGMIAQASGGVTIPRTGSYLFAGGNQASAGSYQDIIASNGLITAELLDLGAVIFRLSGYVGSFDGSDRSRLYLSFLDGADSAIAYDLAKPELLAGPNSPNYEQRIFFAVAPTGTRKVRVHMEGSRTGGTYLNSHIDDISLDGFLRM